MKVASERILMSHTTFQDGERVGEGGYYTNGRLVGNVVWD